jgi:C4-type Zn-finger protein
MKEELICPFCGSKMEFVPKHELPNFGEIHEGAGCNNCGHFFFIIEDNA